MTNGHIKKAEIDVILSGGREKIDRFLVESVIELKEGMDTQHELLEDYSEAGKNREVRLSALETYRAGCAAKVAKLIEDEHKQRHDAHMAEMHPAPRRSGDPDDADYSADRRVWMMWQIGSKVTYVLLAAIITVINIGLHYLFMGEP